MFQVRASPIFQEVSWPNVIFMGNLSLPLRDGRKVESRTRTQWSGKQYKLHGKPTDDDVSFKTKRTSVSAVLVEKLFLVNGHFPGSAPNLWKSAQEDSVLLLFIP